MSALEVEVDAPPVVHEEVDVFSNPRPADPRVCHLLGMDGRPLCGANGLGLAPAHIVAGDPTASPCAGGCGRSRCPTCAGAYGYPG